MRDHEQPDAEPFVGRQALQPRRLRSHLAGQLLEVLRGHRAPAGPQHQRTAHLGVLDGLGLCAADRSGRGSPPGTRTARSSSARGPGRERRCCGALRRRGTRHRHPGPLVRHGAVVPQRPVRLAHGRPNCTSPSSGSRRKCRSPALDVAKLSTSVHSLAEPSGAVTRRVVGASHGTTGERCSGKRCAGVPSEVPSSSSRTTDGDTAPTVPPMVNAERRGPAARRRTRACRSSATTRQRSQPARCRATTDVRCPGGTCSTTSPGRLKPPVPSASTSQAAQDVPVHASHCRGGRSGSIPCPATGQSTRTTTAQDGTAFDRPTSRASPGAGTGEKQANPRPKSTVVDWSTGSAPTAWLARRSASTARSTGPPGWRTPPRPRRRCAGWPPRSPAHEHGLRLRGGQPEGHRAAGRRRRPQADPEQLEELHVVPVRYPVQPVDELVDHLRERLDQRHAGVGDVVVGPLRAPSLDQPLGVVDQVLEPPVVELGRGQRHRDLPAVGAAAGSCSGMT